MRTGRALLAGAAAAALVGLAAPSASAGGNGFDWYKSTSCSADSGHLVAKLTNYDWFFTVPTAQKYHHSGTRSYGSWRISYVTYDDSFWPLVPTSYASGHDYDGTQIFANPFPSHTVRVYWYNVSTSKETHCAETL